MTVNIKALHPDHVARIQYIIITFITFIMKFRIIDVTYSYSDILIYHAQLKFLGIFQVNYFHHL